MLQESQYRLLRENPDFRRLLIDVVKYGRASNGKQRFLCQKLTCPCQTFIRGYSEKGRLPHVKQQFIDLALNGSGVRDTARVLGISPTTVINELTHYHPSEPLMQNVNFTRMCDGTREEYEFLDRLEHTYAAGLPERILTTLRQLEHSLSGYRVTRLEHSLQSATRAYRAGEPEELVVAALLHDIGDALAPYSHSELAAAMLRPFVSEKTYWIVKHHGLFQMFYYAHHSGGDRHARERFKDHPWYRDAVHFCEHYDQNCFDPEYDTKPLEFFEPMVRRVFSQPRFDDLEHTARYGTESGAV